MKLFTLLSLIFIFQLNLLAQSPTDLTSDIDWSGGNSTISDIETAYNAGRRGEETQLSLATNSLGNLVLPANWASYSDDLKGLFILNEERKARGGIDYGSGPVLGLPYEGIEINIDAVAQAHADYLLSSNTFSHTGSGGTNPLQRIENDPVIGTATGCHEFMSFFENLYAAWTQFSGSNTFVVERGIYGWIYDDANSAWGHRKACLIQNADVDANVGFSNNYGDAGHEGFVGFGFVSSSTYNPYSFPNVVDGDVMVMNFFDPVASCSYNVTVLPVELLSFEAYQVSNRVQLVWETASEIDNDYFIVEHSIDGKSFEEIGMVQGKGTTVELSTYNFEDEFPLEGINYYRLMQVDFDGAKTYSNLAVVKMFSQNKKTKIYPNPVRLNNTLHLVQHTSSTTPNSIYIYSIDGRLVYQSDIVPQLGENQFDITVNNFESGIYILKLVQDEKVETFRFLIER